jgi:hypothetical protein
MNFALQLEGAIGGANHAGSGPALRGVWTEVTAQVCDPRLSW